MKRLFSLVLALAAVEAQAITASKEYVDRATNEVVRGTSAAIIAATNGVPKVTDSTVAGWGYIKSWIETDPTISAWAKATSKPSYSWSEIGSKPTFAAVATSGNYNDLTNKPTIPAVINPAVATTRGSAADAKDTKDALATLSDTVDSKLDKSGGVMTGPLAIVGSDVGEVLIIDGMNLRVTNDVYNAYFSLPAHKGGGTIATTDEIPSDGTIRDWGYIKTERDPTVAAKIDNTVTTAFIRERLGVYLYVGEDGGIYVHTGEE